MTQEVRLPTSLVGTPSGTQGSPTVADIQAQDAAWILAATNSSTVVVRAAMEDPTGDLQAGAGLQSVTVQVRRNATGGTGTPGVTVTIHEVGSGTVLATPIDGASIGTADGAQTFSGTWDASVLGAISGADVEIQTTIAANGGGPNQRTGDLGWVKWDAEVAAVVPDEITGDASGSLTAAVASADGVFAVSGTMGTVEIGAVEWGVFISGPLEFVGVGVGTLRAASGDAEGFVDAIGSAAGDLASATGAAAGALTIDGTAAGDLLAIEATATGQFIADEVTGSGTGVLTAAVGTADGSFELGEVFGTADGGLVAVLADADGALDIGGTAAGVLVSVTGAATASFLEGVAGQAIATLQSATGDALGVVEVVGDGVGLLVEASGSAEGTATIAEVIGTADADLAAATGDADAALDIGGTAAGDLVAATADASGEVIPFVATAAGELSAATGEAVGTLTVDGTADADLDAPEGDATGWAEVTGAGTATLRVITGSATGTNETGIPTPARRIVKVSSRQRVIYVRPRAA